jgi:4-aminobutyrate aminotransferase/(S)-3-amino-2-methylpropionate transaminase
MAFRLQAASAARSIARPAVLRRHYASQAYFADEPAAPTVKTAIPGPESTKAIERLSKVFDTRSLNMMADYTKSHGN